MGYAVLFRNSVTCVRSEEMITGMTEAPGLRASRVALRGIRKVYNSSQDTHLDLPPPQSRVHVVEDSEFLIA